MPDTTDPELLVLTVDVVAAYVGYSEVPAEALPELIHTVYRALAERHAPEPVLARKLVPAVSVRRSVFPDHIVCLEDGKKLTLLTRYLRVQFGLTPDAYRAKWGLSHDYPMVAPNYARKRSDLSRNNRLGRRSEKLPMREPAEGEAVENQAAPAPVA